MAPSCSFSPAVQENCRFTFGSPGLCWSPWGYSLFLTGVLSTGALSSLKTNSQIWTQSCQCYIPAQVGLFPSIPSQLMGPMVYKLDYCHLHHQSLPLAPVRAGNPTVHPSASRTASPCVFIALRSSWSLPSLGIWARPRRSCLQTLLPSMPVYYSSQKFPSYF